MLSVSTNCFATQALPRLSIAATRTDCTVTIIAVNDSARAGAAHIVVGHQIANPILIGF